MPKLPVVSPKKLVSALKRLGFYVLRQRGSHLILVHVDGRMAVIPMHGSDIPPGTLRGILSDMDLSVETLIETL
jgi:predicted RNA binding protein YcfA (HicA-like mRNA interferase family)